MAVIEAKDGEHSVGAGIQQALEYAEILDLKYAYSSNGSGFIEHDRTTGTECEISIDALPSPEELWQRYSSNSGLLPEQEDIVKQDYHFDSSGKSPRYYQHIAINRTVEAVAKGQNRVLLTMATGTGKTLVAFHIIHRLWKSKKVGRILFLADRNILVDQTKRGDFKHFKDKMTVIKKHKIDKSYEVYLSLYQGIVNYDDDKDAYKEFSRDFFDLVVIDECHRGSAAEDASWREILNYFDSAIHIGLTATPKETKDVSNIDYFGNPVYTYSLKQGIEDGFLAPYKVVRVNIDVDESWRPEIGKLDKEGDEVEDREYNVKDYDRNLVIDERTQTTARYVANYLKQTNPYDKTIVFCIDIDHAQRMRQALVNELSEYVAENHKYVMKVTGDDKEGKLEVDNFIDPEQRYPVIATTSKLLTTGVDAQTCKLIVLDSNINSMTEFKQIIGRGTRINEEFDKAFFTIMDFRGVTRLFADPDFDGEPVQVFEPTGDEDVVPPDNTDDEAGEDNGSNGSDIDIDIDTNEERPKRKVYVDGVDVNILGDRVQYLDADGKLITQNITDYTKQKVENNFASLDEFLQQWNDADKIQVLVDELEDKGIMVHELSEDVGKEFDPFDLVCHVAYDMPPLTRKERANNVKKRNYFAKYGEQARLVIEALLDKYADTGIENIESPKILEIAPINKIGTPTEIVNYFGGTNGFKEALKDLRTQLYANE